MQGEEADPVGQRGDAREPLRSEIRSQMEYAQPARRPLDLGAGLPHHFLLDLSSNRAFERVRERCPR